MAKTFHRNKSPKRRAPQGELRNLTSAAREKLHSWFREQDGTIAYHEIQKRLREQFDIRVGFSTLSRYYNDKAEEIASGPGAKREATPAGTKTVIIRIEVPIGCVVGISTEEQP